MYIHIGENEILNNQDIVTIMDVQALRQSRNNLRIINLLKSENKDIKTVIIVNRNGKTKEIFSTISIHTLKKRLTSVSSIKD